MAAAGGRLIVATPPGTPYSPPSAQLSDPSDVAAPPSVADKLWLVFAMMAALATALVAQFVVPSSASVAANFGSELPLVTRLVVKFHAAAWLLPAGVAFAWYRWPRRRVFAACIVGLGGSMLAIPLLVFATYLAIFGLAGSV